MRRLVTALAQRSEVRYLFFGGLNTAFSYGLFTAGLLLLHVWGVPGDYAIAITFSWIVSNLTSFVLQRRYVFHGSGRVLREFVKFSSVSFGSFLANIALSSLSVWLGFTSAPQKLVSQLIVTVVLVIVTYLLHKYFSFGRRSVIEPAGTGSVAAPGFDSPEESVR